MIHEAIKLVKEERSGIATHSPDYIQSDQVPASLVFVYFLQVNRHWITIPFSCRNINYWLCICMMELHNCVELERLDCSV